MIKNYCQLPVSLQKSEVGFHFFLAISQNSSVSNKLVHDRFGVKINLPKNSYVSSQYQLAKKLGWTRKKIRVAQQKLQDQGYMTIKPLYFKKRKIGSMYFLKFNQAGEAIVDPGPILLDRKYLSKNYFKLVPKRETKHKKEYNNGMKDINEIINNLSSNDVEGPIIKEKKNKYPIPYSFNNNKVTKKEAVIKKHCNRQDQDVLKFTQWATKHGLNLREEFKNLAYEANHYSPSKIDLKKVLQELKEETLDPLYSIYNLLCMKGKIMEQAGKQQEARFFKEWHRYSEGSYYARETIEQIRAAMCFYRDKIMSRVKLENQKKQKIQQEKESDIQANLTRAARKYWEELKDSDKEEAEKIIKKANILNMKTRGMLDVAKMSNLKNKKALYQFAMSCIEIELLKIDEHKQKIEKLAEMTHV